MTTLPLKNLLAIETSSPHCIVAGCSKAGESVELVSEGEQSHNEELIVQIQTVLEQLNLSVNELDGIVLGIGPGSFTGLRIGLAVVKGIVTSAHIPVLPVSSLRAFAAPLFDSGKCVLSLGDARREEYFSAAYVLEDGVCSLALSEGIRGKDELAAWLSGTNTEAVITGPVYDQVAFLQAEAIRPDGIGIALLGEFDRNTGKSDLVMPESIFSLEPSYLRAVAARTIAERIVKSAD